MSIIKQTCLTASVGPCLLSQCYIASCSNQHKTLAHPDSQILIEDFYRRESHRCGTFCCCIASVPKVQ